MNTYCNPLMIKDLPCGKIVDKQYTYTPDYRSIADPSVVYYEGKWIMYPSYSLAYVTEDFVNWEHIDIGIPHLRYSPAIVHFRDKWYISGHGMSELYSADSPYGPFELCGHLTDTAGNRVFASDGCFLADGDRLYFYHFAMKEDKTGKLEAKTGTVGVECDPDKPWQFITEPVFLNEFDPECRWQCMGQHNQNTRMGWIEGQWMKKIGNRYYLLYSGSGTQYGSYANGVAYSDEGPLTGFKNQKNALTVKNSGIIRGAGHGCLVDGPNDTLWVFYTCMYNFYHTCERRIGMDPVGIDENGELFCPEVTETPQFAPGVLKNPELRNSLSLYPLNFMERPTASSCVLGREPLYACDESVFTWWQPDEEDKEPTLTCRIGKASKYNILGIRIMWRDIGLDIKNGILPGPFKYIVEYAADSELTDWQILIDANDNNNDLSIDYRETNAKGYGIRIRILDTPKGITPGLVSFIAFGKCVN